MKSAIQHHKLVLHGLAGLQLHFTAFYRQAGHWITLCSNIQICIRWRLLWKDCPPAPICFFWPPPPPLLCVTPTGKHHAYGRHWLSRPMKIEATLSIFIILFITFKLFIVLIMFIMFVMLIMFIKFKISILFILFHLLSSASILLYLSCRHICSCLFS